jgi:hypothetical protein
MIADNELMKLLRYIIFSHISIFYEFISLNVKGKETNSTTFQYIYS